MLGNGPWTPALSPGSQTVMQTAVVCIVGGTEAPLSIISFCDALPFPKLEVNT